ncbi:2-amino-4-hydroxy-6-hydroxymethyldihydropteridine diphosphokinase [bacterium]|nr:2-amino-4-hydroxy-6-hydroxymethyldihydropteridine diphosphokinase [bacterium]
MGIKTAYIGLGSNLGDRVLALDRAVNKLKTVEDTRYIALSGLYETSPVGVEGGQFLNAVAAMETGLGPEELLRTLLGIETAMGRVRGQEMDGWRNIDLDLLLLGNTTVEEKNIIVPHPRMLHRRFVMEPLAELAPDLKISLSGITASEAASDLAIQHPEQIIRRLGTLEELNKLRIED